MAVSYQLVIDCASPDPLAHFWAEALHYVVEPPPTGFDSWDDYYRSIGVPEDELGSGVDSIADPDGVVVQPLLGGRVQPGGTQRHQPRHLGLDELAS